MTHTSTTADQAQPARIYRPVELILTDAIYQMLGSIHEFERFAGKPVPVSAYADDACRVLLAAIIAHGSPDVVLKALAAIGGPASVDECAQRIQAAIDASRGAL